MGKSLVIVESPAKAKTINKFLGKNFVVKASMGHVRDLPKNKLGIDIENDFQPDYITIRGRGKALAEMKRAVSSAEKIYLAPDLDREGEAIAWHLVQALKIPEEKTLRVTFNEITKKAIEEAFHHPGRISMDKVYAQQARRILDRLVGYKLSPLLWEKIAKGLSAGRVQSVAVKLIVDREREIRAFVPEEYWKVTAEVAAKSAPDQPFDTELRLVDGEHVKPSNEAEAKALVEEFGRLPFRVAEIVKKDKTEKPLPPFATSQMQQQASIQLRYSAKKTMLLAQQLYEGVDVGEEGSVGLITYMRTDSFNVSSDAQKEVRELISERFGKKYLPEKPNVYRSKKGAQEAHEAIRPTAVVRTPESLKAHLTGDQQKLYTLIWNRFVASQMTPARYSLTTVNVAAGRGTFVAKGKELLFDGHHRVLDVASEGDEQRLPALTQGEEVDLRTIVPSQHFTKPPARFTEATLVKTLEKDGIGRPSTYAPIISTIQDRGYVTQRERKFFATELGIVVTGVLEKHFQRIIDVEFTSKMEGQLDQVEASKANWVEMLRDFYGDFDKELQVASEQMEDLRKNPPDSGEKCEKCGKPLVYRFNTKGKFLGCSGFPDCRNIRPIDEQGVPIAPEETDLTCEKCGKGMVIRSGRRGKFYACSGYPDCKNTRSIGDEDQPRIPPVETDEVCPRCKSKMLLRHGRRGKFLGCSSFPKCRHTVALDEEGKPLLPPGGEQKCEKCGSPMVVKVGRRGQFLACSAYPRCRNAKSLKSAESSESAQPETAEGS